MCLQEITNHIFFNMTDNIKNICTKISINIDDTVSIPFVNTFSSIPLVFKCKNLLVTLNICVFYLD